MTLRSVTAGVAIAALSWSFYLPGAVRAASANPASHDYGDVPVNTTATQDFAITVDAGYEIELATGVGNPYTLDFDTCATFTGPGTCNVKLSFSPTTVGASSAAVNLFQCPAAGGGCDAIPIDLSGTAVEQLAISTLTLPAGTVGEPYPATTMQSTGGTGSVTWTTSGSLPDGLSLDESTGQLSGTPVVAGSFTFAVIATDSGAPIPQTASETFTTTITGIADLSIAMAGPSRPTAQKKPVTFVLTVRNHGPQASEVSVTDWLPSASQFTSLSASQGSCVTPPVGSTGTISCALGDLAAGAVATIDIVVKPTIKKGTISNTASVSPVGSWTTDPTSANNTATATAQVK